MRSSPPRTRFRCGYPWWLGARLARRCLGGVVGTLEAARHDEIFAAVSHLPILLSVAQLMPHKRPDYLIEINAIAVIAD